MDDRSRPQAATEGAGAEERIVELILSNASLKVGLYKTLELCLIPKTSAELDVRMSSFSELTNSVYTPSILRQWLQDAAALERVVVEEKEEAWQTTEAGRRAVKSVDLPTEIRRLFEQQPQNKDIYLQILQFCVTPREKNEVETKIGEHPSREEPQAFVTSFLSALENVGAIEWNSKWKTTGLGRGVLEPTASSTDVVEEA